MKTHRDNPLYISHIYFLTLRACFLVVLKNPLIFAMHFYRGEF